MPSTTSTRTTSTVPFSASHAAALAPTFPAPTTEIFLRIEKPSFLGKWFLDYSSACAAACNRQSGANARYKGTKKEDTPMAKTMTKKNPVGWFEIPTTD